MQGFTDENTASNHDAYFGVGRLASEADNTDTFAAPPVIFGIAECNEAPPG